MSDPVTNVEIEDVLSSIRRLISDDDWARPDVRTDGDAPQVEQDAAADAVTDRFVLTPALRVVEAEIAAEIAQDVPQETAADTAPDTAGAAAPVAGDSMTKLERMIAELEAAVTDQSDEWEPEGTEVEDLAPDSAARPMRVADDVQDADEIVPDSTEPSEAPVAEQSDDAEDDDHYPGETDDALLEEAGDELDDFIQPEGIALDEAVLREMVTDIVRQELQGALGERITRNVRKLVRREIYRVPNSQEFE